MADPELPSPTDAGDALTFLEKLVEVRLLVLALAGVFYLDVWALRANVDPTALTFEQLSKRIQETPVFSVAAFFLSFSVLVAAFFPAARMSIGILRVQCGFSSGFVREGRTSAAKRLSDWAFALVSISLYDLIIGLLSTQAYQGLSWHITQIFSDDSFETVLFRLTSAIFWVMCVALALEIDI